ncbi:hypothetical protein WMY93_022771 [Mugilogobius chulae]|uniref:Doublecortin domain-containing protein n=1 Tax=Mugilogobius chulae TaxID=88201 RepID=A0AAW0NDN4_9GOBI
MQSVRAGMWDIPSKQHASPHQPHPPQTRLSHVSAPPQAKRITFYKSGDSQFGGVKMAVHKRSFKCFDALLDDLSQKMPLPFGVRTVTTPRGTHTIRQLEQLQDGGCYLCSDRRQAKPINMEIASKRPGVWSHHGRRPHRPDSASDSPPGHVPYRQRRLLLVKNTEPAVRKSVVLSRRVTRSLRAFLEEASDVMQFHVRKLYTVEGRKIDNVQNLMTCPNVLVCVGREAFSPLLVNYVRKGSEEKLPGMGARTPGNGARSPPQGAQSRASEQSEGQDSKKNTVNFGLEMKKSIIHPRSDSSNRSARFSMSSEKSYGLSTVSQGRAAIMDDDIEKRVVVNKDGSLSVEMKVRFRLHNDETLQWSTQIKKAPSLTNDSCSVSQGQPHYLQHESCSDPDCNSYEPENGDYSCQCAMDANTYSCCYRQDEQDYDLWKNPAHCHKQPIPPSHSTTESHTILRHTHSSSSTSSCNSTRVVRCRARLTNCEDGSEHSQIVQEEMSVTEQHVVEKDVSVVSRSCSRSEVVVNGDAHRSMSSKSGESEEVERPTSAISASSHVLQELKEDDDELPPSASMCGDAISETSEIQNDDKTASNASIKQNGGGKEEEEGSVCQCHSTSGVEMNGRASTPKSRASSCKSTKETAKDEIEDVKTIVSALSANSQRSTTSLCSDCGGWKVKVASSCKSRASNRSNNRSPKPETPNPAKDEDDNDSDVSTLSNSSNVTNQREVSMVSNSECRAASAMSKHEEEEETKSVSVTSSKSRKSECENDEAVENRSPSVTSAKSENSTTNEAAGDKNTSERVASAMSAKSNSSYKTNVSQKSSIKVTAPTEEENETRSASVTSSKSRKSNCKNDENVESRSPSVVSAKSENSKAAEDDDTSERVASAMSAKSYISAKTGCSQKSSIKVTAPTEEEEETRSASAQSEKSNASARKSRPASAKSTKTEEETRAASALSVKSNESANVSRPSSAKSNASKKISKHGEEEAKAASIKSDESRSASPVSVKSSKTNVSEKEVENLEVKSNGKTSRPASGLSVKSVKSEASKKSENIKEEARPTSVSSVKSNATAKSAKSRVSDKAEQIEPVQENNETRPASAKSSKSAHSENPKMLLTKTQDQLSLQSRSQQRKADLLVYCLSNQASRIFL